MNRFKTYLGVFLLGASVLVGCESGPSVADKRAEVMAIHDEVMPKMDDIHKLTKELDSMRESLSASAEGVDSVALGEIADLKTQLKSADDAMMDWMHKFDASKLTGDKATALEYLDSEMVSVQAVKVEMLKAIEDAKAYLAK
ncbi:hypothetical protein [Pontibacter sp. G13]|uniref:hypothetical protein n=1 Tax=Pontibacter sp. G13 TaxID=3074898 RepID=UPI002889D378|nr:hypothetical protein [Pontibacter sp. G13]WNJ18239.1 hypothetical protein RJD25_25590 [Pontibacter sp. G13]